jgi:hypothetical protein
VHDAAVAEADQVVYGQPGAALVGHSDDINSRGDVQGRCSVWASVGPVELRLGNANGTAVCLR